MADSSETTQMDDTERKEALRKALDQIKFEKRGGLTIVAPDLRPVFARRTRKR